MIFWYSNSALFMPPQMRLDLPPYKTIMKKHKPPTIKTVPNTHKVPVKQWNKWGNWSKSIFNALYIQIRGNPSIMVGPAVKYLTPPAWGVVAWNAAWLAANEVKHLEANNPNTPK